MNNINGISGYSGPRAVDPTISKPVQPNQADQSANTPRDREDRVEISRIAKYLGMIADMPDIRMDKVNSIRQEIQSGSYDVDGKLNAALDQMLEESL